MKMKINAVFYCLANVGNVYIHNKDSNDSKFQKVTKPLSNLLGHTLDSIMSDKGIYF